MPLAGAALGPLPTSLAAWKALPVSPWQHSILPVGQAGRKARPGAPWPGPCPPGLETSPAPSPHWELGQPSCFPQPLPDSPRLSFSPPSPRILSLVRGSPPTPTPTLLLLSIFLRCDAPEAPLQPQPQHTPWLSQSKAALGCRPAPAEAPPGKLAEGNVLP